MRGSTFIVALITLSAALAAGRTSPVLAQTPDSVLRKHHPWVHFNPGSWSQVRQTTETIDIKGAVTNVTSTETKTTLQQITADGLTLKIDAVVEVGGKRLASAPQIVKQGFAEESPGQTLSVKDSPGVVEIVVDGQKISCHVQEVEAVGAGQKRTSQVSYSDKSPYIFKRASMTTDLPTGAAISDVVSEVYARDMPCKVLNEIRRSTHVKTVTRQDQATTITLSVLVESVPGEVVSQSSKKLDSNGRVVRRTTLELLDYRVETAVPRAEESRMRGRRHRQRR